MLVPKRIRLAVVIVFFFTLTPVQARSLWIVGEDFVTYYEPGGAPVTIAGVHPRSSGVSPATCHLWTADPEIHRLQSYLPGGKVGPSFEGVDAVLSDLARAHFLTRASTGGGLERRTSSGVVEQVFHPVWAISAEWMISDGNDAFWSLNANREQARLWATHWSPRTGDLAELSVSGALGYWGEERITLDPVRKALWLAFTHAPATGGYAPLVQLRGLDGSLRREVIWPEKGRLYDSCLEKDGRLLIARDMPSDSGFTVPVFSTLEAVGISSPSERQYAADANLFLDALACLPERLFLAERSIFGSDGSHLVEWNRKPGAPGKELFRLPGRALKIRLCD